MSSLEEYFTDEHIKSFGDTIVSDLENYYKENDVDYHPESLIVYGISDGYVVDTKIYNLNNVELSELYFTELGRNIAEQLIDTMAPFMIFLTAEAEILLTNDTLANARKTSAIVVEGLSIDGRNIIGHLETERDDNNNIKIVEVSIDLYEVDSSSLLDSFYDGVREFYLEYKQKEQNIE